MLQLKAQPENDLFWQNGGGGIEKGRNVFSSSPCVGKKGL
jgi:hypothetical protein